MELRHLRYFIAAAEEEHFGRAAKRLSITRPAVSQIIADLEGEIGTLLFERQAHQVRLTAAGRVLLPQVQQLLGSLSQALILAKRAGAGKSGAVNVGYGSLTLLHPVFRDTVRIFHDRYPEVALSLLEMTTSEQMDALAAGKIDVGFLHFGPSSRDLTPDEQRALLETHLIQEGRLGAVMSCDHALARRDSVSLADLAEEGFIVVPASTISPDSGLLHTLCESSGFVPRIVQEVNSVATQLNLISVGMGVGLTVMGEGFKYAKELAVIPVEGISYSTRFALGWRAGDNDPVLASFVSTLQTVAGSISVVG